MVGSREVVDDGILEEGARGDDVMVAGLYSRREGQESRRMVRNSVWNVENSLKVTLHQLYWEIHYLKA